MTAKLPAAIASLAYDLEIPEHPTERVVNLQELRRAWAKLNAGQPELIAVARDVADHFAMTNSPIGKRAQAALKACGEVWP